MHKADHQDVNLAGTPAGWRRVGFVDDRGMSVVAMVRMASDWTVEVHIDETTNTCFCIGVSPDDTQVIAERWVSVHGPRRQEYADLASQQAAMSGNDATTLDHAGILSELQSTLTAGDTAPAVPSRTFNWTTVDDSHTLASLASNAHQYGDLLYSGSGGEAAWGFSLGNRFRSMRTKAVLTDTRYVLKDGENEIFFLYESGADYFLEALRLWGGNDQRREVTVTQQSVIDAIGASPAPSDVVEHLEPQLVYDPNAFP